MLMAKRRTRKGTRINSVSANKPLKSSETKANKPS